MITGELEIKIMVVEIAVDSRCISSSLNLDTVKAESLVGGHLYCSILSTFVFGLCIWVKAGEIVLFVPR